MRVALLLMLFQFFAPSFFPLVVQKFRTPEVNVHSWMFYCCSFALKEKDEKDHDDFASISDLAPLLRI